MYDFISFLELVIFNKNNYGSTNLHGNVSLLSVLSLSGTAQHGGNS
jgi:hypothetical protein